MQIDALSAIGKGTYLFFERAPQSVHIYALHIRREAQSAKVAEQKASNLDFILVVDECVPGVAEDIVQKELHRIFIHGKLG